MTDVNNEQNAQAGASTATNEGQTQATSAGTQNTEAPGPVPYERFKEVNEKKNSYESEIAELKARNEGLVARIQTAPAGNAGYSRVTHETNQADPMVEQFGYEGAQAIRNTFQKEYVQPFVQQQYAAAYKQHYELGKTKYGDAWTKHDYKDPVTGQIQGNRVLDLMSQSGGLNLESAWNAINPLSREQIEQEIKDKIYAEIDQKGRSTPASASTSSPSSSGTGHAKTVEEAFAQAEAELGK